jgi:hypothetical protein
MRIGDAVQCGPNRIEGKRLFLYTQKTAVPVYCVLPDFVTAALEASPRSSDRYYFWTGAAALHGAIGDWQMAAASTATLRARKGSQGPRAPLPRYVRG